MGYIKGVRKQKNTSYFSYRIHMRLPDGRSVSIEKGGFITPEDAARARVHKIVELTSQTVEDNTMQFDEVFHEFLKCCCKESSPLYDKYISIYKNHIFGALGHIEISKSYDALVYLKSQLCNTVVADGRSSVKQIYLSSSYLSEVKALLSNVYDYAFQRKYISSHPMYKLGVWHNHHSENCQVIVSPFAYLGNKARVIPNLLQLFPKDLKNTTFIDLFAGSGTVGINVDAREVVFVDKDAFMIGILNGLRTVSPSVAWGLIKGIVTEYSLSSDNEQGYYLCREAYNTIPYDKRMTDYWYWGLTLVYCSFNRSTVQVNRQGEYTAPFGKGKVNFDLMEKRFFPFAEKIHNGNYQVIKLDYRDYIVPENAFLYLDPPYAITTASYNKWWTDKDEEDLFQYLEAMHQQGIHWALSNVFENNGKQNIRLRAWVKYMKEAYNDEIYTYYLKSDYQHSNYKRKNRGRTVEVLITNYAK